jgi:hypothetical protein
MLDRCEDVATRAGLDSTKFDLKTIRSTYATPMLRFNFDVRTVPGWMGLPVARNDRCGIEHPARDVRAAL